MLNSLSSHRLGPVLARAAALLAVVVLVCVPALTRAGQKVEVSSHTPSFRSNIECPPKKVTVVLAQAIVTARPIDAAELAPPAYLAPPLDAAPPRSPFLSTPRPLRAPPSAFLS